MDTNNLSETFFAEDDRVDGLAKVTGKAKFTAEFKPTGLTHGVFVCSTIAKGAIKNMNLYEAKNAPGVIDIIYYLNCPAVPGFKPADRTDQSQCKRFCGTESFLQQYDGKQWSAHCIGSCRYI